MAARMRASCSARWANRPKVSMQRKMMKRSLDSTPRVTVPSRTAERVQSAGSFKVTWITFGQSYNEHVINVKLS